MFLYFIEAGDAIKVGVTGNIEDRMTFIQVGNQNKIKLLHAVDLPEDKAREMEKSIHSLFHGTNLHGEWFQSNQFIHRYIKNIKENGLSSHFDWIKEEYIKAYGKVLKEVEETLEKDIIQGNLIALEFFATDMSSLVNTMIYTPKPLTGISQALNNWIKNIDVSEFKLQQVYIGLGVTDRKDKHATIVALSRLCEKSIIDKVGIGQYVKNNLTE